MRLWCSRSCPSVWFFSFLGNRVAWQRWGQRCVVSSGATFFNKCFTEKEKRGVFVGMRCQDGCSALLKNFFFSVCLCKVSVFVWVCACGFVLECACVSGVLTEALHSKSSLPFGKAFLQREKKTWNFLCLHVLRGFEHINEVWVCWSKRRSFSYSVLKCLEHFKQMCVCFGIPVLMFYFRIKLFTWACAFRAACAKSWKSGAKQTVATMGIYEKKENEYLPRHHCTTQHLCLFALGLPAPAVTRKDRKTGWQDTETIHS